MNNFSKARSDVFSTMNNLESLLEDGRIHNGDIASANGYLSELKRMNDWLTQSEEQYTKIEQFVNERSHSTWKAERIRLNLVDIAPDDSELEIRKKYLINSIRRAGIKPEIYNPLTELGIVPHSGYYRIIRVMTKDVVVIDVTMTYPPTPDTILEFSTSENHHSLLEPLHPIHVNVERYLRALAASADVVGQVRSPRIYMRLDNLLNKIVEAVSVA